MISGKKVTSSGSGLATHIIFPDYFKELFIKTLKNRYIRVITVILTLGASKAIFYDKISN